MKQTTNRYAGAGVNQEWLPSQNWQEIAKKRQEKIAVAEAEREYRSSLLKRRIMLGTLVAGTIAIVAPTAIYPVFAQADDIDDEMGYTLAQSALVTFGGRLGEAEPIVSDAEDSLVPVPEEELPAEASEPAEFLVFDEQAAAAPAAEPDDAWSGQTYDQPYDQTAYVQQDDYYADLAPSVTTDAETQLAPVATAPVQAESAPIVPVTSPAPANELSWWSVPSWSTASAPDYDALGIWDVHYYIAHNWTSYGEVILSLKNGDTISVDGQRLRVVDSEYFSSGTDYETVRNRFGWDVWCLQTCYGDHQVRIVALEPIA